MERLLPHAFLVANDPDSVNHFHHSISRRIGNYHLESRLTNQASLLAYKFNFNSNSAEICLFKNFWAIVKIFFRQNKGIKLNITYTRPETLFNIVGWFFDYGMSILDVWISASERLTLWRLWWPPKSFRSIKQVTIKDVIIIVTCCWHHRRGQVGPRAKIQDHKSIAVAVVCRLRHVPDHGQFWEARSKSHLRT